ncbi:MAG: hypothetical protein BWX60_00650 [Candidatus Marinimicrobia bacterium ADurb.Bin030]|nr:MAG: hypothetical protein BWX60_00650 [Candidatus Marinimicrobia bacterium ADurb.Bin030]
MLALYDSLCDSRTVTELASVQVALALIFIWSMVYLVSQKSEARFSIEVFTP